MELKGKSILITGSTRGIGFASARAYLRAGAVVAVNGKTPDSVQKAISKLETFGSVRPVAGDIGKVEQCEAVVKKALQALGGIDILVNAAGVCRATDIEKSEEALWDQTIDINLKGTFFCSKYAISALQKSRGNIVNLASDAGLQGEKGLTVYCASKGGVVNLTRAMALELAPSIRVNCVCPGYVDTDMVRRDGIEKADDPEAYENELKMLAPLRRIATPEEVAELILFVSSEKGRFITGAAMQIDGGTTAGH
jgi:NAD(P)-dependent dehydrogenase (short-subunit alcohol dehydrogenase family)